MDIYSYLNSKDVEAHCRSTGHKFSSLESCFIINSCYSISVEEKHRLFSEIMETMPDSQLSARMAEYLGYTSFYTALRKTIEAENEYISALKKGGSDMVYTYKFRNEDMDDHYECRMIFADYDTALNSLMNDKKSEMEDEPYLEYFGVLKMHKLNSSKHVTADIDKNGNIISIYGYLTDDEAEADADEDRSIFDWCWVYIPVPFKEGDILRCADKSHFRRGKMVLTSVCYWHRDDEEMERRTAYWDAMDMTAYGCWVDDTGHLYDECVHDYHNLEYVTEELHGNDRILKALGACKKGEINESMLIVAYEAVQNENAMKRTFPGWDYLEEYYQTAGIGDVYEKRRIMNNYEEEKYGKGNCFRRF